MQRLRMDLQRQRNRFGVVEEVLWETKLPFLSLALLP